MNKEIVFSDIKTSKLNPNKETKIDEMNKYPEKKRGRKPMNCGKIIDKDKINYLINKNHSQQIFIAHLPLQSESDDEEDDDKQKSEKENMSFELLGDSKEYYQSKIQSFQNTIKNLKEEIEKLKQLKINQPTISHSYNISSYNHVVSDFLVSSYSLDHNTKGTDILCWWCCHSFTTLPIYLPEYCNNYKTDKQLFYVRGNFCSLNCASAYNISLKDNKFLYRNYLLNTIYRNILLKESSEKVIPAPPKEILKAFGGYLTIAEYRNNMIFNKKMYTIIYPPMKALSGTLEEESNIDYFKLNTLDLKLKRKNPINKQSFSFEKSLGLITK